MGNRANIVLVNHDGWQLRYSHWAGCRMLDAVLAGPAMATRYILARNTSDFWTCELWSDGGLLLDLVERRLLFFGEEIMTTMNERRAMFEVLKAVWPGYSIAWAYGATAEIAAYVGAPLLLRDSASEPELKLATDPDRLHHLVTVAQGGQLRAWPLWWGSSAAWHGPRLLDMLPTVGGVRPATGERARERRLRRRAEQDPRSMDDQPGSRSVAVASAPVARMADRVLGGPLRGAASPLWPQSRRRLSTSSRVSMKPDPG